MVMPLILGESRKDDANYLNACRKKRNTVEYDYVGGATRDDARELMEFVHAFREEVLAWLRNNHRELL
jgi:hypothetical protein